jgi:hypothetical protein
MVMNVITTTTMAVASSRLLKLQPSLQSAGAPPGQLVLTAVEHAIGGDANLHRQKNCVTSSSLERGDRALSQAPAMAESPACEIDASASLTWQSP